MSRNGLPKILYSAHCLHVGFQCRYCPQASSPAVPELKETRQSPRCSTKGYLREDSSASSEYHISFPEQCYSKSACPVRIYLAIGSLVADYKVDSLPDVNFDIGELYSGLIPIDASNTSRALFFMFQPTIGPPTDDITIWLNGGPGCSSLEGFFQENGRFLWQPGTFAPVENP